ncbi:MAG: hypothetical protein MUC85_02670 [Anaerolineales bacterium]|jgi:hypothetical protein|nr:hypothetical protein [Anaerolineales bacterium]
MPSTPFIELESEKGIVRRVEGKVSSGEGFFGESYINFYGDRITDALNKCAQAGYEHFDTDVVGETKIYRLKLRIK